MKVPVNLLYPTPLVYEAEWSLSRWRVFARCRREFVFHYLSARGGWDPEMPEVLQDIYRYKHFYPIDLHVLDIIKSSFFRASGKYWHGRLDEYRRSFLCFAKSDAAVLVRELAGLACIREPYGIRSVLEIENEGMDFDTAAAEIYARTEKAALLFIENYGNLFCEHTPLDWIGTQNIISFSCEDVTIYLPRGAVWIKNGRAGWLDIGLNGADTASAPGSEEWRRYWLFRKYGVEPGRADIAFYDIFSGESFTRNIMDFDFTGAKEIMFRQAVIMREWVREAVQTGFDIMETKPEEGTDCRKCRFRNFCRKMEA